MKYAVAYEIAVAMKYAAAYGIYLISLSALLGKYFIKHSPDRAVEFIILQY